METKQQNSCYEEYDSMDERFKNDIEEFKDVESRIMNSFRGTKGEWYAVEYAGTFVIQDGGMYDNANILDSDNFDMEIVKANAQLMVTAPELLVELYRTVLLLSAHPDAQSGNMEMMERIESAQKAINKALGDD